MSLRDGMTRTVDSNAGDSLGRRPPGGEAGAGTPGEAPARGPGAKPGAHLRAAGPYCVSQQHRRRCRPQHRVAAGGARASGGRATQCRQCSAGRNRRRRAALRAAPHAALSPKRHHRVGPPSAQRHPDKPIGNLGRAPAPPGTLPLVETPEVIPITDFRRDAARIIAAQTAAETPVYITQGGYVTAVVLSPEHYRGLARLAERGMAADRAAEATRG